MLSVFAAHAMLLGYVPWCHVLDLKRVYMVPFTVEAIVSRFYNTGNVSVHVWAATSRPYFFSMLQETPFMDSQQATGSLELVIRLPSVFTIQLLSKHV